MHSISDPGELPGLSIAGLEDLGIVVVAWGLGLAALVSGLGLIFSVQDDPPPNMISRRLGILDEEEEKRSSRDEEQPRLPPVPHVPREAVRRPPVVVQAPAAGGASQEGQLPQWFLDLESAGLRPGVVAMADLIGQAVEDGDVALAESLLQQSILAGHPPSEAAYNSMTRGAASNANLAEAERWLLEAIKVGLTPGAEMYGNVVRAALAKGDLEAAEFWLERAVKAGLPLEALPLQALARASRLPAVPSRQRDALPEDVTVDGTAGAPDSFDQARVVRGTDRSLPKWLERLRGRDGRLDLCVFDSLICAACDSGDLPSAESFLQQGVFMGFKPSAKTFQSLCLAASSAGDVARAERWLTEALGLGGTLTQQVADSLVSDACKAKNLSAALVWLKRAADAKVVVNPEALYILFCIARERSDGVAAERMMAEVERAGYTPTIPLLGQAIWAAAAKCVDPPAAVKRWVELAESNWDGGMLDARSRNRVLKGMLSFGDVDRAATWLERTTKAGVPPDEFTFMALISDAAARADISAAEMWFKMMDAEGVKPTFPIFREMMFATSQPGRLQLCKSYFEKALDSGFAPSTKMINLLMSAAAVGGDLPAAEHWFSRLKELGLKPDETSFGHLISAAMASGDTALAEYWFQEAETSGFKSVSLKGSGLVALRMGGFQVVPAGSDYLKPAGDPSSYEQLIKGAVQRSDVEAAERWLSRALEGPQRGALRAGSFNPLIGEAARRADFQRVQGLLDEMLAATVRPNDASFSDVINAAALRGDLQAAEKWFWQGVRAMERKPKGLSFNLLISQAARQLDLRGAERWVARSRGAAKEVSKESMFVLLNATAKLGDLAFVKKWWRAAVSAGCLPSSSWYSDVIRLCIKKRKLDLAGEWVDRASASSQQPEPAHYIMLIRAHSVESDLTQAELWCQRALRDGLWRSPELLDTGLFLKARLGRLDEVDELLEAAVANNWGSKARMFGRILCGLAFRGDVDAAVAWGERMVSMGVQHTSDSYQKLLWACVNARPQRPEIAEAVYQQILADGLRPSAQARRLMRRLAGGAPEGRLEGSDRRKGTWKWDPQGRKSKTKAMRGSQKKPARKGKAVLDQGSPAAL